MARQILPKTVQIDGHLWTVWRTTPRATKCFVGVGDGDDYRHITISGRMTLPDQFKALGQAIGMAMLGNYRDRKSRSEWLAQGRKVGAA